MLLFGITTVFAHLKSLRGFEYLRTVQLERHSDIMQNRATGPSQYRVLPAYLAQAIAISLDVVGLNRITMTALGERREAEGIVLAFILLRLMIDTALFTLAFLYYRKIGIGFYATFIGLSLLVLSITQSSFNSDLAFSTYLDIVFYLSAALVIVAKKHLWILPITVIATLNRETSGLIPFMLLGYGLTSRDEDIDSGKAVVLSLISLLLYGAVFTSLRFGSGMDPFSGGASLLGWSESSSNYLVEWPARFGGIAMMGLAYNLSSVLTYLQLAATFGVLPIMALLSRAQWPKVLNCFLGAIVPLWILLHLLFGRLEETRLLLVPHVLVIIPGALFGLYPSHGAQE